MRTIWVGLLLASLLARADVPELYGLTKRFEFIPERGIVDRCAWRTEDAVVSFIPPADWDIAVKIQEKKLTLRYVPFLSGITIRVATNTPGSFPVWATAEALRNQTIGKFPEALIREEFVGYSQAGSGPVIDIEVFRGASRSCYRVAWVPFNGGLIEFELASPERYLVMCHGAWSLVLGSFRIEPIRKKE